MTSPRPLGRRAVLGVASGLAVGWVAGCTAGDPTTDPTVPRASGAPTRPSTKTNKEDGDVPQPSVIPAPQTYRYGDHPSQYAELTVPSGTGKVPVVVVVHGGFWQDAYGADLGQPLAADLVNRGWAVLNVEYRRVGTSPTAGGGGWPTTGLDVAAAVDALAVDGQRLAGRRLDLTKVIGLGHSAGGQLAGWLASRPTLPSEAPGAGPVVRLSGVVSQAGVLDLVGAAQERVGGTAVPDLMGGPPDRLAEAYAWASPLARLPLGIPSRCVHGTADDLVPISQSERFVAAAKRAGDDSELHSFDGGHFDVITVGAPAWDLCVQAVADLIAR